MEPSWYLIRLRELLRRDFTVTYGCEEHPGNDIAFSGIITAKGNHGAFQLQFEVWVQHLTDEGAGRMIRYTEMNPTKPFLLFTGQIPQSTVPILIEHGVSFLDRAGNFYLAIGPDFRMTSFASPPPRRHRAGTASPLGVGLPIRK